MTSQDNSQNDIRITCEKCGRENVPGWNWRNTLCITCARDEALGVEPSDSQNDSSEVSHDS